MTEKNPEKLTEFGRKTAIIPQMAVAVTKKVGAELGLPEDTVEAAKAQALGTVTAEIVLQEFTKRN